MVFRRKRSLSRLAYHKAQYVLGPLFFVLFLSDLPSVVSGLSALFVDDTLAYDRCDGSPSDKSSSCCRLQHDLTSIHQWSNEWATTFNPAKSTVLDFRERGRNKVIALRHHLLAQCRCLSVRRSSTLVSSLPQRCPTVDTTCGQPVTPCVTQSFHLEASSLPLQRQQLCLKPVLGPCAASAGVCRTSMGQM